MKLAYSVSFRPEHRSPLVKKIYFEDARTLVVKQVGSNGDDVIKYDLRYIKEGAYSSGDETVRNVSRYTYLDDKVLIGIACKIPNNITSPQDQSVTNYTGSYPFYPYVAVGETETLETGPFVDMPAWILRFATKAEFDTAVKKAKSDHWMDRLHDLATNFVNNGPSHGLTHRIGRKGTFDPMTGAPNPEYCNDLDDNIASQAAAIHAHDALEELFPHKIGLGVSAVQVYLDAAMHQIVWYDSQNAAWAEGTIYEVGDYRNHGSGDAAATYMCLQAHTSRSNRIPGTSGGDTYWKKLYVSDFPTRVFGDNLVSTRLNVVTGGGIEELIKSIEADFALNGNQLLLKVARRRRYWRETQMNNFRLSSMNMSTGLGRFSLYDAKKTAHRDRDAAQEAAALRYTQAIWANLSERYEDALEHVRTT